MRLTHPDGSPVHLAYCTNVHPAETPAGILEQLDRYAGPVRDRLGSGPVGLGLWLPAATAELLADSPADLAELRQRLADHGLETVTLNGFPYRGFHDPVVKQAVYHPDWTGPQRPAYTLRLARVLAHLLPEDVTRGSVSTLPLAWREPWDTASRDAARRRLDELAQGLDALARETGRVIRVGLEPEPGCVAETVPQAVAALAGTDPRYLGICLDACHLAVAHEEPEAAVATAVAAGVPIVKTQASAALIADDPRGAAGRAALEPFDEPRFLHQVREAVSGEVHGRDDLGPAFADRDGLPGDSAWRVHFHVPLHREPDPPLRSSRPLLSRTLGALFGGPHPVTDHVEVETYTWSVLPEKHRPEGPEGLVDGIAAELAWCRDELVSLGLRPG
ncbi:metabolite traffic protein EboE [Streptomyces spiramenti]|uniref:Metabolite traffic protein EboE n=1 Tax=Streptomyces spiramenti TaxID=2720606 RepID=A0ABX1AJ10_9ACTN|nr:metabolite traffic protein EboE [Streptomyces spiramenti]